MPPKRMPPRGAGIKADRDMTLQEFVTDYFAEKNGDNIVRRHELAKILVHFASIQEQRTTWARIKRTVMKYYMTSARAPVAANE